MHRHVRILSGLLFLSATSFVMASDEKKMPDDQINPVEIVKKADEATKAVKAVRYQGSMQTEGGAAERYRLCEGSAVFEKNAKSELGRSRVEVSGRVGKAPETRRVVVGTDGENSYMIDHDAKTAYVDVDPMVQGSGRTLAAGVLMLEYAHPRPFSDEINAKDHKYEGIEKVGDVECHKVSLAYANAPQKAVWYFGKNDFLPRKVIRQFVDQASGEVQGSTTQTVTKLEVDPKLTGDEFKFTLPEGYKKSDDFAP